MISGGLGLPASIGAIQPEVAQATQDYQHREQGKPQSLSMARSDETTSDWSKECLEVPTSFGSTDCMLTWPVFNNLLSARTLSQDLLTCDTTSPVVIQYLVEGHHRRKQGINEDNIAQLVEQFLWHVHSKNPILESRQLREAAKKVTEHGVGWNSASCMVVSHVQQSDLHAPSVLTKLPATSLCSWCTGSGIQPCI
jgi:hypothetical protein